MQVEGHREEILLSLSATGARVSNAYPTCPLPGDSLAKVRLIPGAVMIPHGNITKDSSVGDGDASD